VLEELVILLEKTLLLDIVLLVLTFLLVMVEDMGEMVRQESQVVQEGLGVEVDLVPILWHLLALLDLEHRDKDFLEEVVLKILLLVVVEEEQVELEIHM